MADGYDCTCAAHSENECCCGADWTPQGTYDLRDQLAASKQREAELLAWLKELYEAMIRYEGDVGGDAPQEHHEMMRSVAKIITKGECRRNPQHKGADMNIKLNPGEIYAGAIGDTAGNLHHVILLPGDNDDATWQHQKEWAASIGGELPTRLEQALLWQNCREHFKQDWYWSGEENASAAGWAWCQTFSHGNLYNGFLSHQLRARAVRRLPI